MNNKILISALTYRLWDDHGEDWLTSEAGIANSIMYRISETHSFTTAEILPGVWEYKWQGF